MKDRVVTCVYCGHEYPDGTPTSQDEKLTEHIKVCEKHPMRELESQLAAANDTINNLTGHIEHIEGQLAAANARIAELDKINTLQYATVGEWVERAEQAEADAKHFESLYRAAKVEFNFKDSECDRLQEEIEALKISNAIDAAGNEQFQKAFERAEQAEAKLEAQTESLLQERAKREQAEAQAAAMLPIVTAAREYDTICAQIQAMTEPIPGYMLDVARKSRQALHDALERYE